MLAHLGAAPGRAAETTRRPGLIPLVEAVGLLGLGLATRPLLGTASTTIATALLAAQYGFWAGLATGALAAVGVDLADWSSALAHGLGTVLLGALVGLVGDRQRRAAEKARARETALGERVETLQAHCARLAEAKEATERRFAREAQPLAALRVALARLELGASPTRLRDTLHALAAQSGATHVALYRHDGAALALCAALGERERPASLPPSARPPLSRAFALAGQPALLVIECLPFERGSTGTLAMLEACAESLARSIDVPLSPARGLAADGPAARPA